MMGYLKKIPFILLQFPKKNSIQSVSIQIDRGSGGEAPSIPFTSGVLEKL